MPSVSQNTKTVSFSTILISCQSWKKCTKFWWTKRTTKWERQVLHFSTLLQTLLEESSKQFLTTLSVKSWTHASCGSQRKRPRTTNSAWTQTANNKWTLCQQTRSQHTTKRLPQSTHWVSSLKLALSSSLLTSRERTKFYSKIISFSMTTLGFRYATVTLIWRLDT